jgi:hypothetical protein
MCDCRSESARGYLVDRHEVGRLVTGIELQLVVKDSSFVVRQPGRVLAAKRQEHACDILCFSPPIAVLVIIFSELQRRGLVPVGGIHIVQLPPSSPHFLSLRFLMLALLHFRPRDPYPFLS